MKKLLQITYLFTLVLLLGCNENLSVEKDAINKADLMNMKSSEHVSYAKKHLSTLGIASVALAEDADFKSFLYNEIEKTFDGETNVLIKTLANGNTKTARSNESKINQSLVKVVGGEPQAMEVTTSFEGIGDKNYYPQIFIPFYAELKSAGKIGKEIPVLVIGAEDIPVYSGYYLNKKNELVDVGFPVDEDYAKQHEVWVLSINERVDNTGTVKAEYLKKSITSGRTKGNSYPNASWITMTISQYKESWAYGGSEVNCKRWLSFYRWDNFTNTNIAIPLTSDDTPTDGAGRGIHDFSRKDVKYERNVYIDWAYVPDWPNKTAFVEGVLVYPDYLYYVIFEYDPWPTGFNSFGLLDAAGNYGYPVCYRSADGYYSAGNIPKWAADGHVINEGGVYTDSEF